MQYNTANLRRQERSIPESEARNLLTHGVYGILSMQHHAGGGYGVPLHYAWDGEDKIYFHAAREGEKLHHLSQSQKVSFCIVGETHVMKRHFSTAYQSIILQGNICQAEDKATKRKALHLLLQKYTPDEMERGCHYASQAMNETLILQLNIHSWCGKHGFEMPQAPSS